ncbi:MAG: alginate export family protein [Flavobacteriales bacterium]|nr:alginate export family protein [Flavobacteriales bacterium]
MALLYGQIDSTRKIEVDLEFRPRTEFRYGYQQLRNDTVSPSYFTTNRSRINLTYTQHRFRFHTSFQDVRVFGQYGQKSTSGSLSVFEAYVDAYFNNNWFVRIGRQAVELDNKRLFSKANWDQYSRAHDGFNLTYKNSKVESEAMLFFNQTETPNFGTNFSPTNFSNYKFLALHHFKTKLSNSLDALTINAYDGYQSLSNSEVLYMRGTSGGRLTWHKNDVSATLSGYYQYGQLQSGNKINAYYFQPEIKIKLKNLTSQLGMEYMSGDDTSSKSTVSNSFIPLYGVAHSFMGHMDYFTKFPQNTNNGGLINPYLFLQYDINKKLSLKADAHVFMLQNTVLDKNYNVINPYLGFENDLSIQYKINEFTTLDYEFSYMLPTSSMEVLKGGNHNLLPIWSYLMITFKPNIINQILRKK